MTPVQHIRQHALENYDNGWDYIVECYTDAEIQKDYLDECNGDLEEALKLIESVASIRRDRYEEAEQYVEASPVEEKKEDTVEKTFRCPLILKNSAPVNGDLFQAPPLNWIIETDFDYDNYDDGIPF